MRLLNTKTLEIIERNNEPYAILSHTWEGDTEVSFQEITNRTKNVESKLGFEKISRSCQIAREYGYEYMWIDTCCINKESNAELAEALNSMYKWYKNAKTCFIYLADVIQSKSRTKELQRLVHSRWLTRGWTLQELLASSNRRYITSRWKETRWGNEAYDNAISKETGIRLSLLQGHLSITAVSVAERMSWASERQTGKEEDLAYCLLGIFDVSMPIIYGEGLKKAFRRLQEKIGRRDETLFAWRASYKSSGLLAEKPSDFAGCRGVEICQRRKLENCYAMNVSGPMMLRVLAMSNSKVGATRGGSKDVIIAVIQCTVNRGSRGWWALALWLEPIPGSRFNQPYGPPIQGYRRVQCGDLPLLEEEGLKDLTALDVIVVQADQPDPTQSQASGYESSVVRSMNRELLKSKPRQIRPQQTLKLHPSYSLYKGKESRSSGQLGRPQGKPDYNPRRQRRNSQEVGELLQDWRRGGGFHGPGPGGFQWYAPANYHGRGPGGFYWHIPKNFNSSTPGFGQHEELGYVSSTSERLTILGLSSDEDSDSDDPYRRSIALDTAIQLSGAGNKSIAERQTNRKSIQIAIERIKGKIIRNSNTGTIDKAIV